MEIGAGIGNITARLMGKTLHYIAAEKDPLYLHALHNRFLRTPNVSVRRLDPQDPAALKGLERTFDTALCLNVLEYLERPFDLLAALHDSLLAGGVLLVLVPQGPGLFAGIDRTLGHKRRFTVRELCALLEQAGFLVEQVHQLNKIGAPAWWLSGKLFGRRYISKVTLKLFDKTVWFWRRVDGLLPWRGLSLVAVARKTG